MLLRWDRRTAHPWARPRFGAALILTVLVVAAVYLRFALGITGFGPPRLTFQEYQHDLGQLRSPNQVEYRFAFTNTGQRPVQIDDVHAVALPLSDCSCGMDLANGSAATSGTERQGVTPVASVVVSSPVVKPGETGDVTVRFNHPTAGAYDRQI